MNNMRFARNVHYQVKSGKTDEFQRLLTSDVLPLLKQQKGFKEEMTLVSGQHTIGISVWEDKPSAEHYNTSTFPAILAKLTPMLDGTPRVETFDVSTPVQA
jgi:quinol monooxygenase YgiN